MYKAQFDWNDICPCPAQGEFQIIFVLAISQRVGFVTGPDVAAAKFVVYFQNSQNKFQLSERSVAI